MKLTPGDIVHVYNRGNNRQQIFFNRDNYYFFMEKVDKKIANVSNILAYCLMPNHFHFLLHITEASCRPKKIGSLTSTELQNELRLLQSSYANAINKKFQRVGSIFQQNTKYKMLSDGNTQSHEGTYAEVCFHYIHQNPLKAGLVNKIEDWEFSSFNEYYDQGSYSFTPLKSYAICNKELGYHLFRLKSEEFYKISEQAIKPELRDKIF